MIEQYRFYIVMTMVAVIAALLVTWIVREYSRARKAKVAIRTDQRTYRLGEQIQGTLTTTALKPLAIESIEIELRVDWVEPYATDEDEAHSGRVYTAKTEQTVSQRLQTGQTKGFPYRLSLPSRQLDQPAEKKLAQAIAAGHHITWYLVAKLKCKGVNLDCQQRLTMTNIN